MAGAAFEGGEENFTFEKWLQGSYGDSLLVPGESQSGQDRDCQTGPHHLQDGCGVLAVAGDVRGKPFGEAGVVTSTITSCLSVVM